MTAYGPPPGDQPPGQYGPTPTGPAPGAVPPAPYGAQPASPHGAARPGFDPKTVNPLDWAVLGLAVLALIFSFFSYYTYDAKAGAGCGSSVGDVCSISNSAWHGFFGWFGVILALLGAAEVAAAIFAPHVRWAVPPRLVGVGLLALGVVFTLLALMVPDGEYQGATVPSDNPQVDAGHGFSYWLVLIFIVIATVLAAMRYMESGGQLPGALGHAGTAGQHPGGASSAAAGYGQPPGPPPGPAAAPPDQPSGYAPPPPPPAGPPPGYEPPAGPRPGPGR